MFLISDLCQMLNTYMETDKVKIVYDAYLFSADAHDGQIRMTGEPYIYHPIAVARILAEMRMDEKSITAAILHDVIEDTEISKEDVKKRFGKDIADIVDGVTKLDKIHFGDKQEAKADSFRKMILAMVKDIRVILIKLADRLHNMRTLGIMPPDRSRRIATETLEVYAPIANRLGMNALRHELEDLGFKSYYPMRYRAITKALKKIRGSRRTLVQTIQTDLEKSLKDEGITAQVLGREKHIYSIYRKMQDKQLKLSEVYDVYAFRLVVDDVAACYRSLGVAHGLYQPIPGKFKDYIAIPKKNGYQSLHTILFSPLGVHIEVQLRTQEMHRVAEKGIAAHWAYKEGDGNESSNVIAQGKAREWLKNLMDLQKNSDNSIDFLESVKMDLFPDEVYVFSPKGKIVKLPRGATIIDFAYAIHTDIGNTCVAAKIKAEYVPLSSHLKNGQTIDIITARNAKPKPTWLNFVYTPKARSNIRNLLKNLHQDDAMSFGVRLLNKCLAKMQMSTQDLSHTRIQKVLDDYHLKTFDDLLTQVGLGNRIPQLVIRHLFPDQEETLDQHCKDAGHSLYIRGTEGTMVHYGRCCHPIPDDPIIGYISSGRGIVIHSRSCSNAKDAHKHAQKWIDVDWSDDIVAEFSIALRVLVEHRKGVLATIASTISASGANIEQVVTSHCDDQLSALDFILLVRDRKHLAYIMKNLQVLDMVVSLTRS